MPVWENSQFNRNESIRIAAAMVAAKARRETDSFGTYISNVEQIARYIATGSFNR